MPAPKLDYINYFRIGRNAHFDAIYTEKWQKPADKESYEDIGQEIAKNKRMPLGSVPSPSAQTAKHLTLDIDLNHDTGLHGLFFELEISTSDGLPLIEFTSSEPFSALPTHFDSADMLSHKVCYDVSPPCWASFIFDAEAARCSALARHIVDLNKGGSTIGHIMRIPFSFNVLDPRLKFAPWVLPDHEHGHDRHPNRALLTHGGVHPDPAIFLSINL